MPEITTEQTLPEIGTLKYDGAQTNPRKLAPLNFNGLSLGGGTRSSRSGHPSLSDRLLRGISILTSFQPKAPELPPEKPSGDMGVIRYNLPSPIQAYRMERSRRSARFQTFRGPLFVAACLAVAVPVGIYTYTHTGPQPAAPMAAPAAVTAANPEGDPQQPAAVQPAAQQPADSQSPAQAGTAESSAQAPASSQLQPAEGAQASAEASQTARARRVVTVKAGDTLGAIANRNGFTSREIAAYNGLSDAHSLKIGQEILIPPPRSAEARFVPPATPLVLAPRTEAPATPAKAAAAGYQVPNTPLVLAPRSDASAAAGSQATEARPRPTGPQSYTIRSGDTLSSIASRFGIKTKTLARANGLSERDTLTLGKQLKVPQGDGIYVTLRSGESISHLASRYGVKADLIQQANRISDPTALKKGQQLFIPGVEPKEVTRNKEVSRESRRERGDFKQASRGLMGDLGRAVGKTFIWPTAGRISSYFGARGGRTHAGVDIPRPKGSAIHAARAGTVISAGWNGDYGKCVDISHGAGVVTRYAHCSKITVKPGEKVEKGELIGLVGDTGRATGPHLHYEVRVNGRPVNPSKFH